MNSYYVVLNLLPTDGNVVGCPVASLMFRKSYIRDPPQELGISRCSATFCFCRADFKAAVTLKLALGHA